MWAWIENKNFLSTVWNTFNVLSSEPVRSNWPLFERDRALTGPLWLLIICEDPSTEFYQRRTVWSSPDEAIKFPVGATFTSYTLPLCPTNLYGLIVGLKFQHITVPSADPDTTYFRFGLKATLHTESLWPLKLLLSAGSPEGSLGSLSSFLLILFDCIFIFKF